MNNQNEVSKQFLRKNFVCILGNINIPAYVIDTAALGPNFAINPQYLQFQLKNKMQNAHIQDILVLLHTIIYNNNNHSANLILYKQAGNQIKQIINDFFNSSNTNNAHSIYKKNFHQPSTINTSKT